MAIFLSRTVTIGRKLKHSAKRFRIAFACFRYFTTTSSMKP